ncbi:hypothetical protein ACFBZI_11405 [Moraxella sp. ZJ142]|uniref:hypothetical protein n=1 Tax=Moraxella marmotae TaxID=3344520 RepID=UPI0035D48769
MHHSSTKTTRWYNNLCQVFLLLMTPAVAFAETGSGYLAGVAKQSGLGYKSGKSLDNLTTTATSAVNGTYTILSLVFIVVGFAMAAISLVAIYNRSKRDQPTGGAWVAFAVGLIMGVLSVSYLTIARRTELSIVN